ncbi:MAG: FGGY-family carbohydrate kinase [Mycobacterium leprae]
MAVLIGIDVGTTHLKAAAFNEQGAQLALATVDTPTQRLPDGGAEYDPEALWTGIAQCLARVRAEVEGAIAGIGIASMAEAGVLIDEAGRPVYPATAWFDPRSREQAERLAADPGTAALFYRTGLFVMPKHGMAKLLWLKAAHPEEYARGRTWLSMAEWIAFRLTGERAACPTLAARTLGMDLKSRRWAPELAAQVGIDPSIFPPLLDEGQAVGAISAAAAAMTGLPVGTPVALGGHDHPCAALAAGVTGPGQLLDSTGTAEVAFGAVPAPILTPAALATQISQGPLPVPGLFGLQAGASAAGGSVEWLLRELLPGEDYAAMTEMAAATGADPSGLLFLPHLAGGGPPAVEPLSRGALVGLTYNASRGHIVKAVLEGTCYELRQMMSAMESLVGVPFTRVTVTGGHLHNPLWLQLKADILGRDLVVPEVPEATLLGAALLGGVAARLWAGPSEATRAISRREHTVAHRPEVSARYQAYYESYRSLFPALRPLYAGWPKE